MLLGISPGKGKWNLHQSSESKKYSLKTEIPVQETGVYSSWTTVKQERPLGATFEKMLSYQGSVSVFFFYPVEKQANEQ